MDIKVQQVQFSIKSKGSEERCGPDCLLVLIISFECVGKKKVCCWWVDEE